jgi:hypothetical protein
LKTNTSLPRPGQKTRTILIAMLAIFVVMGRQAGAEEIWNGPSITFTNVAGSDPAQAASQDQITPNIWLTRGSSEGLYNAALESGYTKGSLSPVGTEWAYGELANHNSLIYQTWETWAGGPFRPGPASTVGRDAVLHILPGDIYLGIQFTSWGGLGGGFSYVRSTQLVPEPSASLMMLAGLVMTWGIRNYRGWRRGRET